MYLITLKKLALHKKNNLLSIQIDQGFTVNFKDLMEMLPLMEEAKLVEWG
jgi:hypothetical protein